MSEEIWQKIFDVNVTSAFMLLKESVPLLRQRGGGSIVFMSSISAFNPQGVCTVNLKLCGENGFNKIFLLKIMLYANFS